MQKDLVLEYERFRPSLQSRAELLQRELEAWLEEQPGLKIHKVSHRLKAPQSLAQKLARPDRSYANLLEVTDLLGIRVITYFEDGVEQVGKLIENRWPVTFTHSVDKRRKDGGVFGYRSLHYVCRLHEIDASFPVEARFEIQIRTVLEHAWAEIEHDLGYKVPDEIPVSVRHRLSRLAGLLELADQEFVAIRQDLDRYMHEVPKRIEAESELVLLDRYSLGPLLHCEEVHKVDLQIASALNMELGTEPFFPDYLLKMLASSGVRTVADVRNGVREHAESILAMVKPYFAFAFRTWQLSPSQMEKVFSGYSLFFLVHVLVLKTPSLGIDKVERLTRLYRELDYPDDLLAAQTVASTLVEAFRQASITE